MEGGGEGSEKLEPFSLPLWSSLPQPQGQTVIREAAGLNVGLLNQKKKILKICSVIFEK